MQVRTGKFIYFIKFNLVRGVEIVKFLLVQGQVIGHNVLVQRKFCLSDRTN